MSTTTPLLTLVKPAVTDAALISVINSNMDLLDNAATLAGAQTLTNKTLTSPHLTTATVDSGGLTVTAGGLTVTAGGLTVTAGNVGIGLAPSSNIGLNMVETINGSAGAAVAVAIQPTLNADVNNGFLYGLLLQGASVYNPNGHTGVAATGFSIGAVTGANANNYGLVIAAPAGASTDNISLVAQGAVRFSALGARVAGDVYVIVDASGNLHKSAVGPAS